MLANNLNEILENFDFTDSIITQVKWADNLIDLIVVVDYYWDIQEGRDDTRLLSIVFKNCIKANFQMNKELPLVEDEINIESCFTIVLLKEKIESETNLYKKKQVEIFTTDYSKPWLSVLCSEVELQLQLQQVE